MKLERAERKAKISSSKDEENDPEELPHADKVEGEEITSPHTAT